MKERHAKLHHFVETAAKVAFSHVLLYVVTFLVLDFVEDHVTGSGTVALFIVFLTLPVSFLVVLWAVGAFPHPQRSVLVRSAVITAIISPFSLMLWLTIFVNVVGYEQW